MDKQTFVLRDQGSRDRIRVYMDALPDDPPTKVTLEPYKPNRSLAQNRLMWMWFNEIKHHVLFSTGKYFSSLAWKLHYCEKWLGVEVTELPNGDTLETPRGTSNLTTAEFSEFLNNVEHDCGEEHNVRLTHPDDLYHEAMGRKNAET